jgi:hypothetical protein
MIVIVMSEHESCPLEILSESCPHYFGKTSGIGKKIPAAAVTGNPHNNLRDMLMLSTMTPPVDHPALQHPSPNPHLLNHPGHHHLHRRRPQSKAMEGSALLHCPPCPREPMSCAAQLLLVPHLLNSSMAGTGRYCAPQQQCRIGLQRSRMDCGAP